MRRLYAVSIGCLLSLLLGTESLHGEEKYPFENPWLRLSTDVSHLKVAPKGHFLSFTKGNGLGLYTIDLSSLEIFEVSQLQVESSSFWSPDGQRLVYREISKNRKNEILSSINVYDCILHQNFMIEHLPLRSGFLTFDPRDLSMYLVHEKGIRVKKLNFPDKRLARWQLMYKARHANEGRWVATPNGIIWATSEGLTIRKMEDDRAGITSFDISPDGRFIAWATRKDNVFVSEAGKKPFKIGNGRDPSWHPEQRLLVYAAARMVGNKPVSYDLRVSDILGTGRFVTATEFSNERWPVWDPKGQRIIYTKAKTTDLFSMEFKL